MDSLHKKDFLEPGETDTLENFKQLVRDSVIEIFSLKSTGQTFPVDTFLENIDHGALHAFHVYKKAIEIADRIEQETGEEVDRGMLYFMAITHDSGRFHISTNEKKQLRCERGHNKCGMGQIRKAVQSLKKQGITVVPEKIENLTDYVYNHDFFNTRLDGEAYAEPKSLEGRIARLADRMSTDISTEARRYWDTGKRLKTPYFKGDISFEDRINFSFPQIKNYIKSGKFDEFTFFLTLLSMSGDDFAHPTMKAIYNDWARDKHEAIATILEIAREEGFSETDIQKMQELIEQYILHFNLTW